MQRPKALRRPELVEDWQDILKRGHSNWAQYLTLASLLIPEFLYRVFDRDTNPQFWWWLAIGLVAYGIFGRVVKQMDITHFGALKWILIFGAAIFFIAGCSEQGKQAEAPPPPSKVELKVAVANPAPADPFMTLAINHIAEWEGLRLEAYLDVVGVPTVCFGETKGVQLGDVYAEAECKEMLRAEILHYQQGLHAYFTHDTIANRLPYKRDVAYVSLAYNVGVSGAGKSTAVRRLNAGDIRGGCEAISWWNKAGGRVWRGLVRRRASEVGLCLSGLTTA